uniref:Retrotransposon gag domain-containing protein n=1 Tax=Nelumbo nucifera TaxID=4432 RepID=A0A822YE38_NELNU|nr:TPA_asm: hypothetical protein HUJ06_030703 [Nelumbo nucifera]
MARLEECLSSIEKNHEELNAKLTEILDRMSQGQTARASAEEGSGRNSLQGAGSRSTEGLGHGVIHRTVKIDLPRFNGTHFDGWFLLIRQYFQVHDLVEQQWVSIASMGFEGQVVEWYQWYYEYHPQPSWEQLVSAMEERFNGPLNINHAGRLSKLTQTTTVSDYQEEFQRLSSRVTGLSESYLMGCFIAGLKPEVRVGVENFEPPTLV